MLWEEAIKEHVAVKFLREVTEKRVRKAKRKPQPQKKQQINRNNFLVLSI